MTKKLFHSDSYQATTQATVTSIQENIVILNQTVFFAFSGGQESDYGTIGEIEVVNAVDTSTKQKSGPIEYELTQTPDFAVGDTVDVEINLQRRRDIMRLHTAVHLAYYAVIETLGELEVIGSHISQDKGRIDFATEINLNEIRQDVKKRVDEYIQQEHEIQTQPDKTNPTLRWWKCQDYKMACAGTHV